MAQAMTLTGVGHLGTGERAAHLYRRARRRSWLQRVRAVLGRPSQSGQPDQPGDCGRASPQPRTEAVAIGAELGLLD